MNKNKIIYKIIRKRVSESTRPFTEDSNYVDEVTEYIIRISGVEILANALAEIELTSMDMEEFVEEKTSPYWKEKVNKLQDISRKALLEVYRGG